MSSLSCMLGAQARCLLHETINGMIGAQARSWSIMICWHGGINGSLGNIHHTSCDDQVMNCEFLYLYDLWWSLWCSPRQWYQVILDQLKTGITRRRVGLLSKGPGHSFIWAVLKPKMQSEKLSRPKITHHEKLIVINPGAPARGSTVVTTLAGDQVVVNIIFNCVTMSSYIFIHESWSFCQHS